MPIKKIILLTTLLYVGFQNATAQPGMLDHSFGNDGIVKTDMGATFNYNSDGRQVLVNADGTMYFVSTGNSATLITKKSANGSTDSSYGNNGWSVQVNINTAYAALQADGKIVVAGSASVARFNTDGTLDKNFDGDGIAIINGSGNNHISCLAIQGDGKIVVGGVSGEFDAPSNFLLFRLNTNGSLDGDIIYDDRYSISGSQCNAVAIQSDGKIIAAGNFVVEGSYHEDFLLARYNTDLSVDSTFSNDGKQVRDIDYNDIINAIAVQTNGKIVVAGSAILRYNADGSPDNTFNGDGTQTSDFIITSLAIQNDGKIVVGGSAPTSANYNFAVARYGSNGTLDNTFDTDGKQFTDFGPSEDRINSIAVQNDGKLIALGYVKNAFHTDLAATRYNTNGSPDNSFHSDGKLTGHILQGNTSYKSIVVQADGKIITAGNTWNGINWDFSLARYNPDGSPDNSFDGDGNKTTDFSSTDDYAYSVALQPNGKILVAGSAGNKFAIARYNVDGSPDNTFSADGKQTTDFGSINYIKKIVIQSNGKIVAAGGSAMARYNADGSLDASFTGGNTFYGIDDIAVQNDDKILVTQNLDGLTLSRYNSDGSPDNTFGDGGKKVLYDVGDGNIFGALAIQSDGKIIIGGYLDASYKEPNILFALLRINADGSPDNTFNSGAGLVVNYFTSPLGYATSVKIQNDNKIILAGASYDGSDYNFTVLRYNPDGSVDNSFGENGIQSSGISTGDDRISGIALSGNRLYAAGYGQYPGNFGVVAAYLLVTKKAPVVNLTAPVNNARYTPTATGATVILDAAAAVAEGSIASVQFYNNGMLLFTDSISPYTYTVNDVPIGKYSFVARATANGLTSNSATIAVSVLAPPDKGPVVNITDPLSNTNYAGPAIITIHATASDADGTIKNVKFYNGSTLLATDSTSPYSCTINNATPGSYTFYAEATDNANFKNSSATTTVFVVIGAANKAPVVRITSPSNNANYPAVATVVLHAEASDEDGTITCVRFYNGSTLLKADSTSPYSYSLSHPPTGHYSFVAQAVDNNGLAANSATVYVGVGSSSNKAPLVNISVPVNNATYVATSAIVLNATASDADGTISSVKFYNGATLLATDNSSPYSYTINNAAAGSYKLYAIATDNNGLSNSSSTTAVFVVPASTNKAPLVKLINPANNAIHYAPGTIFMNAEASDADGTIASVKFYMGSTLLFTDNTSPYSYTINNLPVGNYSFVAKATDNSGLETNSSTSFIVVSASPNQAPVITLNSPVNNADYLFPATITLQATASDADGSIAGVKFYNGSLLLKTVTKGPFTYTMTNVATGNYNFYAMATDNNGATNSSATSTVFVSGPLVTALAISAAPKKIGEVSGAVLSPYLPKATERPLSLKLLPNPAHNLLNITSLGWQKNKQVTLSLISASGVVIKTMQSSGLLQTMQLNIASLAKGVYIIKMLSGGQVVYRQFVKL